MKSFFIIGLLGIVTPCICKAQGENWEMYMAKYGDKPGSVLVDLGLAEHAPDSRYPYLLTTGPQAKNCNDKGLPDKTEIDDLEQILDATGNFVTGVTPKILAGTLTYNCQRLNYYYIKDTAGVRNAIARLYSRTYSDRKYTVNIKRDKEWKAYRTFLYPTPETMSWIENNKIITGMLQKGDDLSKKKDIYFIFSFHDEEGRKAFVAFVHKRDYRVDELSMDKDAKAPYKVEISKNDFVKPDIIADMTMQVEPQAKLQNGIYEGWGLSK